MNSMFHSLHKLTFGIFLFLTVACGAKKSNEGVSTPDSTSAEGHDPEMVDFSPDQYKSVGVQLGNISYANLSNYIKASGIVAVTPQQTVSITSPYGGIIRSTTVLEGIYIRKGQVVATLENPEFIQLQQDYLESSSQLSYLRQDLTRQEELVKENIAAGKSLQRAGSEYNSMVARVEGLKTRLRQINISASSVRSGNFASRVNIIAPTDGYVTKVFTNVGKYLNANEAVADIVNTNNLLVNVKVFEKDVPRIKMGQRIRFRATGDSAERKAEVFLIGKDIDSDRTVEVFGRIIAAGKSLLPGMFVNAIMEVGTSSAPALPQEAVVQAGGRNYIFILAKNDSLRELKPTVKQETNEGEAQHISFRRIEVGTTITENGFTGLILPGNFDPKSKIVIKGAYDLLSKMNNAEEEE